MFNFYFNKLKKSFFYSDNKTNKKNVHITKIQNKISLLHIYVYKKII